MSDDLPALLVRLEKEVEPLEKMLRLREAEEGQRLRSEEARVESARTRAEKAQAALKVDQVALAALEQRRAELLARVKGWRGQLWSLGWSSVVLGHLALGITAFGLLSTWAPDWALWAVGGNAVAFALLYFLIPAKK